MADRIRFLRRSRRPLDRLLLAITSLYLSLLCLWAIIVPLFDAPDEPQHLDMVLSAWDQADWPGPQEKVYQPGWFDGLQELRWTTADTGALDKDGGSVGLADLPPVRRSWNDLTQLGIPSDTIRNQMAQHPPLYYRTARAVLSMVPSWGDRSFAGLVTGLRLLSVVIAAALPLLVWSTARSLSGSRAVAATAALSLLTVPMLLHINSTITNDVLLTTLAALAMWAMVGHLRDGTSGKLLIAAAAVSGAAATKAFGLVLLPGLLVTAVVAGRRHGAPRPRVIVGSALALAPAAWWYVENLILYGSLQPQGFPMVPDPMAVPSLDRFARVMGEGLLVRFWASIGWAEVEIDPAVAGAITLVLVMAVGAGLLRLWRRGQVPESIVLTTPILLILGIVLAGAWARYGVTGDIRGVQGRYLFVGLPGLAVLAGQTARDVRLFRAAVPVGPLLVAGLAVAMNAFMGVQVLTHYWTGPLWRTIAAWNPMGPAWVAAVLLAVGASGLLMVGLLLANVRRGPILGPARARQRAIRARPSGGVVASGPA